MSDSESIQFDADDSESIMFQQEELEATTRSTRSMSTVARAARARGASIRRQQQASPGGGGGANDDAESIAFFEDNQSVASSGAPGQWFFTGEGGPSTIRTESPAAVGSPKDAVQGRGGVPPLASRARRQFVSSEGDDDDDAVAALDKRLQRIALRAQAAANGSFSNRSIQFVVDDEDDEVDAGLPSPTVSQASPPATALSVSGGSATAAKKTVVSNTLRQRGGSLKGLKTIKTTAPATAGTNGPPSDALRTAASPLEPPVASVASVVAPQQPVAVSPAKQRTPQRDDAFPSFAEPHGTAAAASTGGGPLVVGAAQPATADPSVVSHHKRTDSSKLVLDHLKEQESSDIFVQHKAMLLGSPLVPHPQQPVAMGAPQAAVASFVNHTSGAAAASDQRAATRPFTERGTAANRGNVGKQLPRRRSSSPAAIASGTAPNGPATHNADASMAVDIIEARRFTTQVRAFNAKQQEELLVLDERLQTALLNRTTVNNPMPYTSRRGTVVDSDAPTGGAKRRSSSVGSASGYATWRQPAVNTAPTAPTTAKDQRIKDVGGFGHTAAVLQQIANAAHRRSGSLRPGDRGERIMAVTVQAQAQQPPARSAPATATYCDAHLAVLHATTALRRPSTTAAAAATPQNDDATVLQATAVALSIIPPSVGAYRAFFQHHTGANGKQQQQHHQSVFFRSGVRLTDEQAAQFYTLVRERQRGHALDDAAIVWKALTDNATTLGAAFVSHDTRRPCGQRSPSTCEARQRGHAAVPATALPRVRKQRTEIFRNVFDLLDIEGVGYLRRADLSSLQHMLSAECDALDVPSKYHNHQQGGHLLAASTISKAAHDHAFKTQQQPSHPASSSSSHLLGFSRFGCQDAATFRVLCQFAAHVVLPRLIASEFEEIAFPDFGLLLQHRHVLQPQAGNGQSTAQPKVAGQPNDLDAYLEVLRV